MHPHEVRRVQAPFEGAQRFPHQVALAALDADCEAGKLGFESQNRSGFQPDERVVRSSSGQPSLVRSSRFMERKGYVLSADFYFIDSKTGELLHKERFSEEVLYAEDQRISPLSSYFELMDRLLPNFLGVLTPQRIRGTRVLLR